jgi:hypothetical protein
MQPYGHPHDKPGDACEHQIAYFPGRIHAVTDSLRFTHFMVWRRKRSVKYSKSTPVIAYMASHQGLCP